MAPLARADLMELEFNSILGAMGYSFLLQVFSFLEQTPSLQVTVKQFSASELSLGEVLVSQARQIPTKETLWGSRI